MSQQPSEAEEPLNIVILGASFAGLSAAHHFFDIIAAKLGTGSAAPTYRVVVISPSTHIFWNIGAPRALVAPGLLPHKDAFVPIERGFRRHRGNQFTFIQGWATSLDTSARTITVGLTSAIATKRASQVSGHKRGASSTGSAGPKTPATPSSSKRGSQQTIPYHALILATGSQAHSPLLSLHGPHEKTIDALDSFHARIPAAKSIVVCGGGPSGVETAGQLATYLNKNPSLPFLVQNNSYHPKRITLITGNARCLPNLPASVGKKAEKKLRGLGVEILHNARLVSTTEDKARGTSVCVLSNNTTVTADLYVAATGVVPNTAYLSPKLLNSAGYIATNADTLRVEAAGPRVYAVGDCASYSKNYVLDVYDAVPVLMHNMLNDLLAHELRLASPYGGNEEEIAALEDERYEQNPTDSQLIPITRYGGVGVVFGYGVPSVMVHVLKGRDYRIGKAKVVVENGNNPY
ncbi:hypothetical protein BJ546DRAFT_382810 [Cryomyces antarcticus]